MMNLRTLSKSALVLFLLPVAIAAGWQSKERPPTEDLLPETTVLYVQARDLPQLFKDMEDSNFGRMLADEKVAPLFEELMAQAKEGWNELSENEDIGIALEDLTSLPHGEICFAAIAPRRKDTQFAFFMDIDEESEVADRLIDRGRELAERDGATVEDETGAVDTDVEFTTVTGPDGVTLTMFRKDGTVVVTSARELSEEILDRWMGRPVEKIRPLKENRKFTTIMNRCRGTKDVPPEMRYYMDPIEFFKSVTRGDAGTQVAIGFLPVLGLDGLLAIGGSGILNEGEFESVNRFHVMLANPRAGIIEMIALRPGKYEPAAWIPNNCSNYMATSWDIDRMYSELVKIVDTFSGEGTLENQIENNINSELDLDFKEDLLGSLNGTFTWITWSGDKALVNSQSNGVALGLKDVDKAREVIDKVLARINEENPDGDGRMVEDTHKGVTLWRLDTAELQDRFRMEREEGNMSVELRAPEPSFAIIGDYFVFSDNADLLRVAIETDKGDLPRLVEDETFARVSEKMTRLLGTDLPAGVIYSQPEHVFKQWLEIAKGDDVTGMLDTYGAENKYVDGIRRALEDNPLPEFEDIRKYFAPSGAFVTSDDTGYHILGFQLRADETEISRKK